MQITLTVTAGPHEGQVFSFTEHDTLIVGRSERARFQLRDKDRYFSRFHFLIEVNPPRCRLMDLGSHNGTFVNGERVASKELKHGDDIKAGHTFMRVSFTETATLAEETTPLTAMAAPTRSTPITTPLASEKPTKALKPEGPTAKEATCRACGAILATKEMQTSAQNDMERLLCASCVEQAHRQPQSIPGYYLVRELGRGSMGIVFLALRNTDHALVAMKTILPEQGLSPVTVGRFLRESDVLRELRHPHIVAFHEMGESDGRLWFAMDYVRGTDAWALLQKRGRFPIRLAVELTCQLLEALAFAHAQGFVHRDLKPANLLVTKRRGQPYLRLADFGLARKYQASQLSGLTMAGSMGGTVAFMPPEQVLDFRNVAPAADQYSAAAVLYYLLTGAFIYDFPPRVQDQLSLILQGTPVSLQERRPDVPAKVAEVVHWVLAIEPKERFPDVVSMRQELLPFTTR